MKQIRSLIHAKDPFSGFHHSHNFNDKSRVAGWNYDREYFPKIMEEVRPKTILEVGSWLGGSAIRMATIAQNYVAPEDLEVVCIDTWLGASEFWSKQEDSSRDLKLVNGYPSVYYDFLSNVFNAQLQNIITPFPISSSAGLKFLIRNGVRFDLAYIDGSHDYEDVVNDIKLARQVAPVLFGDDFYSFQDVGRAVTEAGGRAVDDWFWRLDS